MAMNGVADPQQVLDEVFARVARVLAERTARDDAALAVTMAYLADVGPAWLMRAADETRLDVLTLLEVHRRRSPSGPAVEAVPTVVVPPV